jgi:hypothetical protein
VSAVKPGYVPEFAPAVPDPSDRVDRALAKSAPELVAREMTDRVLREAKPNHDETARRQRPVVNPMAP